MLSTHDPCHFPAPRRTQRTRRRSMPRSPLRPPRRAPPMRSQMVTGWSATQELFPHLPGEGFVIMSAARLLLLLLAGPHLPPLDRSGPRRTSSASSWSQCAASSRSQCPWRTPTASAQSLWTSPDFNRRESERCALAGPQLLARNRCGPRRPSTGESLSAVGFAGLQPARFGVLWASPDFNRTSTARNKPI